MQLRNQYHGGSGTLMNPWSSQLNKEFQFQDHIPRQQEYNVL